MPADSAPPDLEVMRGIIDEAREAIWCIRFEQPVDITGGEDATVDQIFGNPAVWTMCNAAMARAYELVSPAELNGRDVHFHWPRNAVNEAFIRAVIASGYYIDGAVSEDFRRDGTPVLMENDVRAHVEGGRLYRLWGTLRELRPRAVPPAGDAPQSAALGFELLPLPACLISAEGAMLAGNAAWRQCFGPAGADAARMILRSAAAVEAEGEFALPLPLAGGGTRQHVVSVLWHSPASALADDGASTCLVATARLMTPGEGEAS
jgi:hypothetical protein